jgi:hypothetical protein
MAAKSRSGKTTTRTASVSANQRQKFWEIMNENLQRMRAVMQSMNTLETHHPISRLYDFSWAAKVAQDEPERVLFVDVGGGKGQAIKAISKDYPGMSLQRFVLQDRQDVIEEVKNNRRGRHEGCKVDGS